MANNNFNRGIPRTTKNPALSESERAGFADQISSNAEIQISRYAYGLN